MRRGAWLSLVMQKEKLAMVKMVKQKSRKIGTTMALFIARAWISRSPAGLSRKEANRWVANSAPPSQQPDRREGSAAYHD